MNFVSATGVNHVAKWYRKKLSLQEQSNLDTLLDILAKQKTWTFPDYLALSGAKYKGLAEIRLKGDQRIQMRLIGFQGPNAGQFTFLIGCFHKGSIYDPPSCFDTAVSRKRDLDNGNGSICEHDNDEYDDEAEEG